MSWTPPVHTLLCPITGADGQLIESIVFRPFTHGAHAEALARAGADEDDRYIQLAQLATGLPEAVLDSFKRPDFLTVTGWVNDWIWSTSMDLLDKVKRDADGKELEEVGQDGDEVPLLMPIEVMGVRHESLTLTMPALKATRMMKKQKTGDDRTNFITAHCTGLMVADLALLSVPDWNQLQKRIDTFLNKPAAFFQNATSK
ncbi:phage tail assembly protein [Pseudomonas sp. MWU12-2345]|uniref:phage tail assembly protein n=1 Tax=Pseudomonas sp. MWU12-2345 TaxID=2928689 RepID=UPI00200DB598|nr:phage tail assembly protein [Pseudomonas sp. MWU12-2345]